MNEAPGANGLICRQTNILMMQLSPRQTRELLMLTADFSAFVASNEEIGVSEVLDFLILSQPKTSPLVLGLFRTLLLKQTGRIELAAKVLSVCILLHDQESLIVPESVEFEPFPFLEQAGIGELDALVHLVREPQLLP